MGETGCGKTRLVKFLCDIQKPTMDVQNMLLLKVGYLYLMSINNLIAFFWATTHWCHRPITVPVSADVPLVTEFLVHIFQRTPPLAIDTIQGMVRRCPPHFTMWWIWQTLSSRKISKIWISNNLSIVRWLPCGTWRWRQVFVSCWPPTDAQTKFMWHLVMRSVLVLGQMMAWPKLHPVDSYSGSGSFGRGSPWQDMFG